MSLRKSFDGNHSECYLPPIHRNDAGSSHKTNRSQSYNDIGAHGTTQKLIETEPLRNIEQYQSMNEKQLLREHESLLKVLKKYQEVIDINLFKKRKERERQALHRVKSGEKRAGKAELLTCEISNKKKIIANYLREIKGLEEAQKHRKLHEVLEEKKQFSEAIVKIKKQIFALKNEDNQAGKNLVTDRALIEKELSDVEKNLKIELTRNAEFKKKTEELKEQLRTLKKECEHINIGQLNAASHQKDELVALNEKKCELQQAKRNYTRVEESIQEVIMNKTKRNKGLIREISNLDNKMEQLNSRIAIYKQNVTKYQKVLQISPKS